MASPVCKGGAAGLSEVFRAFFAVIPATVLYDDTIPANAKLLYGQITTMTVYTGTDGRCTATNAQLAAPNGLSEDSISRLIKELEKAGHIEVRYTPDARDGHPVRSIYQVIHAPPLTGKNADKLIGKKTDPLSAKMPMSNVLDNNIYIPPQAPQGGQACQNASKRKKRIAKSAPDWKPERFEGFWKFYPRHEGRQNAVRAWDKLQPDDALLARIGYALTAQKQSDEWRRGIGIPHASTYLNQQRWTDQPFELPEEADSAALPGEIDRSGLRYRDE
nr:MAG TPA: replisome organizer protein [Caudoviricetes sp.]